ncbi:MAG: CoA-binding protein [Nitriliruptorales bacterium]
MDQSETIERILGYARRIAVVGLSPDPNRPSNGVAAELQRRGYEIVPVNPNADMVLGQRSYRSLADVPGEIDLVDVFRRAEHLPGVAREAVGVGARGLWFQLGLVSEEGRAIAEEAGLDVVEDRCLMVEVSRLAGLQRLPPPAA